MSKYIITDGIDKRGPITSGKDAALWLIQLTSDAIFRGVDPTKWHIEEIPDEPKDVPELIPEYSCALTVLADGIADFEDVRVYDQNKTQMEAFNKLLTLCKAWNKADGWKPDYKNDSQKKWFPRLAWKSDGELETTVNWHTGAHWIFDFKTEERARQFGEKFIDLFRQLYGIREGE